MNELTLTREWWGNAKTNWVTCYDAKVYGNRLAKRYSKLPVKTIFKKLLKDDYENWLNDIICYDNKYTTDEWLSCLSGLTSLRELYLRDCPGITDAGLAHLSGLTSLQVLDLRDCPGITDAGLAHLSGLTSLQALYLGNYPGITDAGLAKSLPQCKIYY